jgi:predicted metal-binding membrane protein
VVVGALVLAGAHQLSPIAARCLDACRAPLSFVAPRWTGGADVHAQALRIGADYGRSCLGCCAGLMVVMLVVGMAAPVWMVGLGVLSAAHKLTAAGPALARATGIALLGTATVVAGVTLAGAG